MLCRRSRSALYPAWRRLENRGWLAAKWGQRESGRGAKFYSLAEAGQEVRFHIEQQTEDLMAKGLSRDEARLVMIAFGGPDLVNVATIFSPLDTSDLAIDASCGTGQAGRVHEVSAAQRSERMRSHVDGREIHS